MIGLILTVGLPSPAPATETTRPATETTRMDGMNSAAVTDTASHHMFSPMWDAPDLTLSTPLGLGTGKRLIVLRGGVTAIFDPSGGTFMTLVGDAGARPEIALQGDVAEGVAYVRREPESGLRQMLSKGERVRLRLERTDRPGRHETVAGVWRMMDATRADAGRYGFVHCAEEGTLVSLSHPDGTWHVEEFPKGTTARFVHHVDSADMWVLVAGADGAALRVIDPLADESGATLPLVGDSDEADHVSRGAEDGPFAGIYQVVDVSASSPGGAILILRDLPKQGSRLELWERVDDGLHWKHSVSVDHDASLLQLVRSAAGEAFLAAHDFQAAPPLMTHVTTDQGRIETKAIDLRSVAPPGERQRAVLVPRKQGLPLLFLTNFRTARVLKPAAL